MDALILAHPVFRPKSCNMVFYVCWENLVAIVIPPTETEGNFRLILAPQKRGPPKFQHEAVVLACSYPPEVLLGILRYTWYHVFSSPPITPWTGNELFCALSYRKSPIKPLSSPCTSNYQNIKIEVPPEVNSMTTCCPVLGSAITGNGVKTPLFGCFLTIWLVFGPHSSHISQLNQCENKLYVHCVDVTDTDRYRKKPPVTGSCHFLPEMVQNVA